MTTYAGTMNFSCDFWRTFITIDCFHLIVKSLFKLIRVKDASDERLGEKLH